ncbi:LOW QUALITY PROTEIN: protein virilizer homolog [Primulina tabacum]|uniref:LOW QUALITY PROTEIN: protein virilizer homolog n=1 Tax=Primulina tabacum TaxID=48773 RepID=UPI003F59ADBF
MGRTEPCVLYAHTFVHPHLDEYVDEVLFSEPVVITSCEFLEQNAASLCPAVKLIGATSPPSFALEVFIQCEGETRFRRLCMPCLYSHSSSNVLEVEALVTNHLVIRGSYRSLSMVIYGNTAEDLGQFNIEVDIDSSLIDTVCAIEGNLEDLPPAFRSTKLTNKELLSPLNILNIAAVASDVPLELRLFLQLVLKILDSKNLGGAADKVFNSLLSVASSYQTIDLNQLRIDGSKHGGDTYHILADALKELLDVDKAFQNLSGNLSTEYSAKSLFLESEAHVPSSKELLDTLQEHFYFCGSAGKVGYQHLSQYTNTILWLSVARLLCSSGESCSYFVNYGGMKQLGNVFTFNRQNSTTITLLLLEAIEQATRHSIGCEGFLGWWPREKESLPSGISDGYNQLLKMLLKNQRHDVGSLATYILHRMRFYEIACKYEFTALSILGGISAVGRVTNCTMEMLTCVNMQLKTLLKLIKLSGPIDDPSPMAAASRSFLLVDGGVLTYKATNGLINLSNCCFSNADIDSHLLSLLKERGFLPLSAALLSSSILRSETGRAVDLFVDIVLHIEAIILSLLFCRSGLAFLLNEPDVFSTVMRALRGNDDFQKEDPISLRYATFLISKGFFCPPKEVGVIAEMHARALIAVDSLCELTPNTEEFLWVLWDLCRLSRSECGRQALLALVNFPEALAVLMTALHCGVEFDPVSLNTGLSPLHLAIFHSAAEIFEVIVTDSTSTSLTSWIDHAKELHRALLSSSPGSNMKDAPARLLEWIDAGVVYHKNGAIGLLQYAAVLASGGDAHMASNSVLASDMMDADYVVGDSSSISDGNVVDTLIGKRITKKDFPGVILRDSSVAQLTTAFRILSFISDDLAAAAALYDEGAVMVIHAVLINCKLMLERSSNIYDYLVDESIEGNSTSDLLLERSREKSLFDLLIPSLVLLINLLQKLKDVKEQHRNTKLMNTLLQLHREVSPKLAACAADLTHSCPEFALGFGAACHLLASALAYWPICSWTPGLFRFLLDSLHATSLLVMGPKEICSLLCLLNDLLPDENIWMWKHGRPTFSVLRALAVGTLLGPLKEKQINWYLRPGHSEKLIAQLSPQLAKLGEIILHCAISMSIVLQDILRIFIIRIACLNMDNASALLKPLLSWISHRLSDPSVVFDVDAHKVHQLLNFICILLEHPNAKPLLLKEGGILMLTKVLDMCIEAANSVVKHSPETINVAKYGSSLLSCCIPVFKCISLICDGQTSVQHSSPRDRNVTDKFTAETCFIFLTYLLKFCMVLPVGKELFACLSAFKEMGSSGEGQSALLSIFTHIQSLALEDSESRVNRESNARFNILNASEWMEHPPLLCCWNTLLSSFSSKDVPAVHVASAIDTLSLGAFNFCIDKESLNWERASAIKYLFGVKDENAIDGFIEESLKHIEDLKNLIESETSNKALIESANLLLLLLQKSPGSGEEDATITRGYISLYPPSVSSRIQNIEDRSLLRIEEYCTAELVDRLGWECPENLRDRLTQTGLPAKRKISMEGNRHSRGDISVTEATTQSSFSRGSVPVGTPTGPTRRDNFRQRKPNTSRPPSMHVDDYVARERNADGTNSSNVIALPRIGTSSGRPPSIHVDEFMARQRERQCVVGMAGSDAATRVKTIASQNSVGEENSSKPQRLKPDLDDDLQGIDIVFDAEESEPDDKLPFPQSDDNLRLPAPVVVEQLSPHSIVEETESDINESSTFSHMGTPLASNMDETIPSEFSSRLSGSRPGMPLTREPSISSDKKFSDQLQDSKNFSNRVPGVNGSSEIASSSGVSVSAHTNSPSSSVQYNVDSFIPPNLYSKENLQNSRNVPLGNTQVYYDPKFSSNQPPLPPMPPPPAVSPLMSRSLDPAISQSSSFAKPVADMQAQVPPGFHVQLEYGPLSTKSPTPPATSIAVPPMKFGRASLSSSVLSTRPPPLPPTPPPYSVNASALSSLKNSTSQSPQYFQTVSSSDLQQISVAPKVDSGFVNPAASRSMLSSYPPPPLGQPLLYMSGSIPANLYGNNLFQQHGDNLPNFSQNVSISLASIHSIPTLSQLQPLQPPQISRPPPQHLRPPVPISSQLDQGPPPLSKVSPRVQQQTSQVLQPLQASSSNVHYQTPREEHLPLISQQQQMDRSQLLQLPGDRTSQQLDPALSLQEYFKSPEAIQSLLSDRDKLCQLLEQHPKLMQMLQERLGRL